MNKTEYLLSMLMELPRKVQMIEKELQTNEYTTEEVTLAERQGDGSIVFKRFIKAT